MNKIDTNFNKTFEAIKAKIEDKIETLELLLEVVLTMHTFGIDGLIDEALAEKYFEELLNRL